MPAYHFPDLSILKVGMPKTMNFEFKKLKYMQFIYTVNSYTTSLYPVYNEHRSYDISQVLLSLRNKCHNL